MNIRVAARVTPSLIVLGWASCIAALTLFTIFQGLLLPRNINGGGLYTEVVSPNPIWFVIFYLGNFLVCVLSAIVISDFVSDIGRTMISFFAAFGVAALITDVVLALPDTLGIVSYSGGLQEAAQIFTFGAFFPVLFLIDLSGTTLGMFLGDRMVWS